MKDITITQSTTGDTELIAELIRSAYRTVADDFNLTEANCPKHPSNCTAEWIKNDFDRGVTYYLAFLNKEPVGCVALDYPEPNPQNAVYMERLAVIPSLRHMGLGQKLVRHCIGKAGKTGVGKIGIGIIDEQQILKQWYRDLGFHATGTKKFDHLPFTVGFMEMSLTGAG